MQGGEKVELNLRWTAAVGDIFALKARVHIAVRVSGCEDGHGGEVTMTASTENRTSIIQPQTKAGLRIFYLFWFHLC